MNKYTKRIALAVGIVLLLSLLLSLVPSNEKRVAAFLAERLHSDLKTQIQEVDMDADLSYNFVLMDESLLAIADEFEKLGPLTKGGKKLSGTLSISRSGWQMWAVLSGENITELKAITSDIRWTALLPALLAVALAIATRRLLLSLLFGVICGAIIAGIDGSLTGPLVGSTLGTAKILKGVLWDDFHFYIFLFTFSLIGMVNVATSSGGMAGLAKALGKLAKGTRSTQAATALLGLAIFFDDYSNTVVVGSSMRPLTDRLKISREKLAYLVDSTAAPIAALALVSTWIGYEVSLIGDAMTELKIAGSPYAMFISTLPFRFYCILSIIFVFINIVSGREFGPMYKAQKRAAETGQLLAPGSQPLSGAQAPKIEGKPLARNALLPILSVIFLVLLGMVANGAGVISPSGFDSNALAGFDFSRLLTIEGNYIIDCQDGTWVLSIASIAGSILAVILGVLWGKAPLKSLVLSWLSSWKVLALAFGVLILAWSIGDINTQLGTGPYLVATLADTLPVWLLPLIIFVMGAFISFSTGSSWGTMAVLIPAAVPLAYHMGGTDLMIISMGAVLDGSIFGDHCSPLSDTTIMSSIASGCDHVDHVKTQLPYSLVVALAAVLFGYIEATMIPPIFAYAVGFAAFSLFWKLLGRKVLVTNN